MSTDFVPPPSNRSYLDDIDEDEPNPTTNKPDEPNNATTNASSSSSSQSATSASTCVDSSTSSAVAAPVRSTGGLDDIDEDEPTPNRNASNKSVSSSSVSESVSSSLDQLDDSPSSSDSPAAVEVARILAVIAKDNELKESINNTAAGSNSTATNTAQPDHFSVLNLPQPQVSLTGEGVWTVSDDELKRTFKRLVVLIHPDKNPTLGAKDAFEAVKLAHSVLSSESDRYDYVKSYTNYRRLLNQRRADFVPPSAVTSTLDETLAAGRQVLAAKKKQSNNFAARLEAQAEAKRQAVLAGDAARRREEEKRRQEELKRKVMEGSSSSESEEEEMSIAEKIRRAKQGKSKKIRLL